MVRIKITLTVFTLFALALGFNLIGQAGSALKSDSVVKVKASGTKPNASGQQEFKLTLDISKGWHIYGNPVKNKDLEDAQTEVTISAEKDLEKIKIGYPVAHEVKDKVFGIYYTYEGKIEITGMVNRTAGDNSPLNVKVVFQACNDKKCLAQSTVKLAVP